MLKLLGEVIYAAVKIMIAHGSGIVSHRSHGFYFRLTFKIIEIRCTLKYISRVKQQNMLVLCPYFVNHLHAWQYTSQTLVATAVHRKRIYPAVYIIGVKYDQRLLFGRRMNYTIAHSTCGQ